MPQDQRQHAQPVIILQSGGREHVQKLASVDVFNRNSSHDEAWLRDLIFRHPDLLPLDEIEPAFTAPIPICTELPLEAGGVDLFLVNEAALPVIVETKLWSNPEARRHVVAQGLDYARALTEGGVEAVEDAVARRLGSDVTLFDVVARASEAAPAERDFYDALQGHLERGRILVVLAGDGIRKGVDALTSFLRSHATMEFTFGLVEMPIHRLPETDGLLVTPRVLAKTIPIEIASPSSSSSRATTTTRTRRTSTSEKMFFEMLGDNAPDLVEPLQALLDELRARGVAVEPGQSASGSLIIQWPDDDKPEFTFAVLYASGGVAAGHYFRFGKEREKEYFARLANVSCDKVERRGIRSIYVDGNPLSIRTLLANRHIWIELIDELIAEAKASKDE
jgi:hypothetical protein